MVFKILFIWNGFILITRTDGEILKGVYKRVTNGTSLLRQPLPPHQPQPTRNGHTQTTRLPLLLIVPTVPTGVLENREEAL